MLNSTCIGQLADHEGREVTLHGWVYNTRSSGAVQFVLVRDGTGIVQAVAVRGSVPDDVFGLAQRLTQESAVTISGLVRKDRRAPGGYELTLTNLQLVHEARDYPITPKEHGPDFLLSHRHLWVRSARQHAILRIRAQVEHAIRGFLDDQGFVLTDSPILTPAACEGTSTLFETDYFGDKAYLSQSGQLYVEATAMAFGKVYCFGPTFRAEKSKTRRHLTEFWMVEPEMAYADLDDMMALGEQLVGHVVQEVLRERSRELEVLKRDTKLLAQIEPPFPRITYDEAIALLQKQGEDIAWGDDFGAPHEIAIGDSFQKPVFVHRYPAQIKAFYMEPDPSRPEVALCADLLAPEGYGEIIGGGQRTHNLELLEDRIAANNLPREAFEWYLDLRRYGSVPHAGFGLGIERTVAWICGIEHVRETIPFPRMLTRIYP
ncbi:MAG: asparagine--tRNA ligase [Chloroflexi bacterium]|nr:asparagine--tRNA ligase [Chloroflexota bacterium]